MSVATNTFRRSAAVLVLAGGLTAAATAPAMAAPNQNRQQGLANVNLQDVTAQIPIGIAANVCNISVNALSSLIANGAAVCTTTAGPLAVAPASGPNQNRQSGLVNVNAQGLVIQVPIGVAANVCNVGANILASAVANGAAPCDAVAGPTANG